MQHASGKKLCSDSLRSSGSCGHGSKSKIHPYRHFLDCHHAAALESICLGGLRRECSSVIATARCSDSRGDACSWRRLEELRNILFTSRYLLDPYAVSQDPCTNPNGILEPACHPTSMVQHRLGRAGPRLQQDAARRCWSSLGSAHGCHLLLGALGGDWELVQHCSAQTSTSTCLKTNNSTCTVRVRPMHLPAPQPWRRVTSPSPGGQAQPFCFKQKQIISCSLRFPQRQEHHREGQDSRCSCENHQWRDLILQLSSASMLELVNATIEAEEVVGKPGGFPLLQEGISAHLKGFPTS